MAVRNKKSGGGETSYRPEADASDNFYTPRGGGKKQPPKKRRSGLWIKLTGSLLLLGFIGAIASYLYFSHDLPPIQKVTDYQPPLATQVFSSDLELIGNFAKQFRLLTTLDEIPPMVRKAFIASEDARFFEHSGVDYLGIMRALIKNIQAGSVRQGGSTITQQVAKSLLLTPERKLKRKIREALLAYRIERSLTKEEILYLYLNQIYLGHGAYGVAAAARVYFNKDLRQLTLAEVALLAAMPTAPSKDNPIVNPERAKRKRSNVLRKMHDLGFISEEERAQADEEPFAINNEIKTINDKIAPYFAEHVRRYLLDTYGEDLLYEGGMKVYTTLSLSMQIAAQDAVRWNLHQLDRRQGYRGPIKQLSKDEIAEYKKAWEERAKEAAKEQMPIVETKIDLKTRHTLEKVEALVVEVSNKKNRVKILTEDSEGFIPLEFMKWARKPNEEVPSDYDKISRPSEALKKGDLILVRQATLEELPENLRKDYKELKLFALTQEPEVQGAILAMNPTNGFVRAMVGGYDYEQSEFNRAVQAKRQPGSAFKPIIYSAALDKGYTPATTILDAPVVFDDPSNDKIWRPKNYSGKFYGEIPFRTALIHSHNVVTVKILQDIGIDFVIDYARKLGIASELTRDSTLALGSSVVTPLELTTAYAVFASGGAKPAPVFIQKIVDRSGKILERSTVFDPTVDFATQIAALKKEVADARIEAIVPENNEKQEQPDEGEEDVKVLETDDKDIAKQQKETKYRIIRPKQVISEETAYMATHLLSEVVRFGTGFRVRALNRPAAGKTGTTNENVDAWFVGFTPDLVATAWVGFDGKRSLGKLETGSRAASPMWLRFMQRAVEDRPKKAFAVPAGITFAKIDPKTGALANDKTEKPILEAFKDGSEPSDQTDDKKTGSATKFFLEE